MALTLGAVGLLLDTKLKAYNNELVMKIDERLNFITASINEQNEIVTEHTESLNILQTRITELENSLDEQINRSMRNNIIMKGITEEKGEAWAQTKDLVSNIISRHLNLDKNMVYHGIERAHRGGNLTSNKPHNKPRNIFIRLFSTEDVKTYLDGFRNLNMNNRDMKIIISQQFSDKLSIRRNEAMIKRRELKTNGQIISGYVEYPATLMIKKAGDKKYSVEQEF